MYWDIEVTSEDEDEMITKIAHKIHEYGIDAAAIIMIESFKPLSYIGSQMGRFFFSPFLPIFGDNIGIEGEKIFQILENRENMEKLINAVEELNRKEEEQKKIEKAKKIEEKRINIEVEATKKKGWRLFK